MCTNDKRHLGSKDMQYTYCIVGIALIYVVCHFGIKDFVLYSYQRICIVCKSENDALIVLMAGRGGGSDIKDSSRNRTTH